MNRVQLWLTRFLGGAPKEPPSLTTPPPFLYEFIAHLQDEVIRERLRAEEFQKLRFEKCGLCTEKVISTSKTTQEPLKTSRESWPRMKRHFEERDAREAYWRAKGGIPTDKVKEEENAGKIS